jgi:hypothetical protein
MSRTVAEMVTKLGTTGRTITSAQTLALRAMSESAKTSVLNEARRIAPDLNLSGVGRKGVRIGARYTVGATKAEIKATGPWQFVEYNTKPHIITSRGLRGSRKSRASAVASGQPLRKRPGAATTRLNTPFGPRFYVRHPGTRGQTPWEFGVTRIVPQLPEVAARVYRAQIGRIFR